MRNGTGGWKKSWRIIANNAKHSALRLRGSMKIIGDPDLALEDLKEERDKSLKTAPMITLRIRIRWFSGPRTGRSGWVNGRGEFFRKSTRGNTPSSFP